MKTQIQSLALIALVMVAARLPAQTNTAHPAVNPFDALDTTNDIAANTFEETKAKAEKGNAAAQFEVGNFYFRTTNYIEAAEWYQKSANQGLL